MVTRCASYVRGRVLRVTRLDSCGRVVYGEDSVVTSKGFVSVGYTANVDDGEEINEPNANGERCVYVPAVDDATAGVEAGDAKGATRPGTDRAHRC